jgi:choline-sulfatase
LPRPNVLLIMVDQLAAQWLPAASAPALHRLAASGVVFERAYCPSPLCAPSRAALLTGRLPSSIGVYDNAAELRASEPTFVHALRAAGYDTCLSGKMHFVGPDQLHGFEQRLTTDVYPADLDWTPDWRAPLTERLPWYHTMESVLTPGECAASMQMDYDDEVAHRAVRKLRDLARERERPFFLCVSFTSPHDPWEIRPEFWERYDAADVDLPAVGAIPRAEADPHSLRLRDMSGIDDVALSDDQVRRARHGYFAAISYVDDLVGSVLATLDATGLRDDTVVAFTADHGELLGERGLWYKMAFFEPSARVPLIVSAPGRFGARRVAEPVSLLDLGPTLLSLCGVEDAAGSLLSGPPRDVAAEYLAEGVNSPAVMLRRGGFKYIWCEDDPEQLYDLSTDPHELTNLAAGSPERCASLRAEVHRRWDLPALKQAVLGSQEQRRLVVAALREGRPTSWNFVPRSDGEYVGGKDDLYELQRRARLDAPDR